MVIDMRLRTFILFVVRISLFALILILAHCSEWKFLVMLVALVALVLVSRYEGFMECRDKHVKQEDL